MGGQSGLSELSVISWVSAFEGCPLSGVPLYLKCYLVCLRSQDDTTFCMSFKVLNTLLVCIVTFHMYLSIFGVA